MEEAEAALLDGNNKKLRQQKCHKAFLTIIQQQLLDGCSTAAILQAFLPCTIFIYPLSNQ